MARRRVKDRMRLKKYIVIKLEEYMDHLHDAPGNGYFEGWRDALRWVLNKE